LKNSLRQSQRDHERELANHGVTVRELQTLISSERKKCETMEQQVKFIEILKFNSIEISLMNVEQKY
jgi:hypothetical protein